MISMAEGRHLLLKIVQSLHFCRKWRQRKQNKGKRKAPENGVWGRASKQKIQSPHPLAPSFDTRVSWRLRQLKY